MAGIRLGQTVCAEIMNQDAKKTPLLLLGLFCLLPTIQTAVSVHFQWHTPITYPAFKILMISVPIIVWLVTSRTARQIAESLGLTRTNLLPGILIGLLMSAVILAGYYILLRRFIDPAPLLAKVDSLGLLKYYWIMAVFISLLHSFFEEYYWRGFLLSELRNWISTPLLLCLLSGFIFGIHHTFAMLSLFPLPLVFLCVLGTMLAGVIWSWMRIRGQSIWDCYISHVLADLAVMWIGYDLILRAK